MLSGLSHFIPPKLWLIEGLRLYSILENPTASIFIRSREKEQVRISKQQDLEV